jgi:hypothetical protein
LNPFDVKFYFLVYDIGICVTRWNGALRSRYCSISVENRTRDWKTTISGGNGRKGISGCHVKELSLRTMLVMLEYTMLFLKDQKY